MLKKHRSPIWEVSSEEFREIILQSKTMRQVLDFFGMNNKGSNYITVKNRCIEEGIDLDDFNEKRKEYLKIKRHKNSKITLDKMLINGSNCNRTRLKQRMIQEGLLKEKCSKCGIEGNWQGEKLSLVLDHINGISNDNRIENLRLLCPNCHSQTPTFAGRNVKQPGNYIIRSGNKCSVCKKYIYPNSKNNMCSLCFSEKRRKVKRPTEKELADLISRISMVKIGQQFGVSDNAVRKWAKSYGLL